jgi:hypothetical protein
LTCCALRVCCSPERRCWAHRGAAAARAGQSHCRRTRRVFTAADMRCKVGGETAYLNVYVSLMSQASAKVSLTGQVRPERKAVNQSPGHRKNKRQGRPAVSMSCRCSALLRVTCYGAHVGDVWGGAAQKQRRRKGTACLLQPVMVKWASMRLILRGEGCIILSMVYVTPTAKSSGT